MQINEKALKPCPFCGKAMMLRGALWPSEGDTDAVIHAEPTDCPMYDFCDGTADGSIAEKWNRRALTSTTPPDVAGLVERLEGPLPERHVGVGRHGDRIVDYDYPAISRLLTEAATALRLSAGGGWRCPDTGHVYSASDLASIMERRDKFIVSKGLWGEFIATLDGFPASPTVEAGHVE